MYRALSVSRQVPSTSARGAVRVIRRRLATDASQSAKKTSAVTRIFWTTTAFTATFYVGSTFAAFNNQTYHNFFSDHVPLGQSALEFAEGHGWDSLTIYDVFEGSKSAVISTQRFITDTINGVSTSPKPTKPTLEQQAERSKSVPFTIIRETKAKVESVATEIKQEVIKDVKKVEEVATVQTQKISDDLHELVQKAEAAIAGKPYPSGPVLIPPPESTPVVDNAIQADHDKNVYATALPIGFEPPPGFSRPSKSKPQTADSSTPSSLPLVAPSVSSLAVSEPIISHLAGTIDNLASYLAANPEAAAKATDVLETAKGDLTALARRIETAKEEEREKLEAKLDEQTREYTLSLMALEMEAQDKIDSQEEGFRKFFDEEKFKIVEAYRQKLDHELKTQTELINERLKEEVIAQGIELQRRWIREIKVRVEEERGGRLAKLDELSANLKKLERIALDNSSYLDENIRIHTLWSAVRAVDFAALASPVRKPFREELRVLRHIATAREDPVVAAALENLEGSEVPDVGVEPFSDLATWFTSEVSPKVCEVALVPDVNAGVLSYLASSALSRLRFKRHGLVSGDDVLSVIARAEHYLNEKDLDSAARELNQLKGPAQLLLRDWLEAARRRLEVQQALEIVQAQATLASLLIV